MERDHGRGLKQQPATAAWTPSNICLNPCFSWPVPPPSSSSYTCGYCRREFPSAQALGGHMNVHRRDRARLRQCCSAFAPSPNLIAAHHHRWAAAAPRPPLPNLNLLPPHCTNAATAEPVVYSFFSATVSAAAAPAARKAAVGVSLDLGIAVAGGVCNRGGGAAEVGGLDLELRLGCSWE